MVEPYPLKKMSSSDWIGSSSQLSGKIDVPNDQAASYWEAPALNINNTQNFISNSKHILRRISTARRPFFSEDHRSKTVQSSSRCYFRGTDLWTQSKLTIGPTTGAIGADALGSRRRLTARDFLRVASPKFLPWIPLSICGARPPFIFCLKPQTIADWWKEYPSGKLT